MKKRDNPIHGKIKLLDDNGNDVFVGNGIFFEDDRKIYATIAGAGRPKVLLKYRILFVSNNDGRAFLSIAYHVNFEHFSIRDEEVSFNMGSYVVSEDEMVIRDLIDNGISGVSINLKCKTKKANSVFANNNGKTELEISNYGSIGNICPKKEYDSGFSLSLSRTFRGDLNEGRIINLLIVNIETKDPVRLNKYYELIEPFELYWVLFKNDIVFDIDKISFIVMSSNGKLNFCYVDIVREQILNIVATVAKPLSVEYPEINIDTLEKILKRYKKGLSNDKIAYGFSKYLFLYKKNIIDTQMAVLYSSAALDSISAEICKNVIKISNTKKKKIKANIEKVRKYVLRQDSFEQETIDFYTDNVDKIYSALRNSKINDAVEEMTSTLGLVYDSEMRGSVRKVLNARNQIMHGQSYEIEKILLDLNGYSEVEEVLLGDETKSYIPNYKFGCITNVLSLLAEVGRKFFE